MRHIKAFVSSTNTLELMHVIEGITKKMRIPVRMLDTGVAYREWDSSTQTNASKVWINFEVCDDSLSWDDLTARIDTLNDKTKWAMPCEIELYGRAPEGYEVVHNPEDDELESQYEADRERAEFDAYGDRDLCR